MGVHITCSVVMCDFADWPMTRLLAIIICRTTKEAAAAEEEVVTFQKECIYITTVQYSVFLTYLIL